MAYLQRTDYTLSISLDNLDEILTQAAYTSGLTNDQVLTNALNWAVAKVAQRLAPKYQIAAELGKDATDTSRLYIVISWVVDFALWKLHATVNPRDVPDIRKANFEMATTEMLESLKGENPIPGLAMISNSTSAAFVSSGAKFISNEFKDGNLFDPIRDSPIPGANGTQSYLGYYP